MKPLKWLKGAFKLVGNVEKAINAFDNAKAQTALLTALSDEVRHAKLDQGLTYTGFQPYYKIGSTIEMAEHYNLEFYLGTCFGDCQAILKQDNWKYSLSKTIPSTNYGTWSLQEPNKVNQIYGYGKTLPEAIMRCLINARIAEVI